MENEPVKCPACGQKMKYVPAGTSKTTGKPYSAFYSCTDYTCKQTMRIEGEKAPAYRPTKEAMAERKEMFNVMDHKADAIAKAQARKEESMTTMAINRDATLITVACLNGSPMLLADDLERHNFIKNELNYWKDYLQNNFYNVPF